MPDWIHWYLMDLLLFKDYNKIKRVHLTAEDGCLEEFENTAAFSREYQAAQDCMCDTEHMVRNKMAQSFNCCLINCVIML